MSNLLNSAVMLSMDYSKTGDNAKAASVLTSVLDATRQYLDSAAIDGLQLYIDRYSAFAPYQTYSISIEGTGGIVPFRITPVGKPEKGSVLMTLDSSSINGLDAEPLIPLKYLNACLRRIRAIRSNIQAIIKPRFYRH